VLDQGGERRRWRGRGPRRTRRLPPPSAASACVTWPYGTSRRPVLSPTWRAYL